MSVLRTINRLSTRLGMTWAAERLLGLDVAYDSVPARVRMAIERQQDDAERLTAWVQLAIILFFGTLYSIAPKTYSGDWLFPPVAVALVIFLGAALVRLAVTRRGRSPGLFLAVMVVIDLCLLLALIWSFHIQYEQPPAFSLKAPTLLYVFIFIALRALRFEARYVLLAGVTAAVGWSVLATHAVLSSPDGSVVTRDYVLYLTSNSVLIGAELDKVIAILVVTVVLSVALGRARRLMVRSVVEEEAARDLSRFFAPEIATRITGAEHRILPGHGEARHASILNVDIRGFTQLAKQLTPSDLIGVLVEYQSRMVPAVQQHGGSIDKFLGDGLLATFGAAAPSETHAADALRALESVVAAADAWSRERLASGQDPLVIGAAVDSGDVVFGAVGDDTRLEYTVIGDAVNLAAKLEKHNKSADTRALATKSAFDLAAAQGYRPRGETRTVREVCIVGVDEPLDIVVVAG